ncbi:MAG: hypothetical protein ACE5PT_00190 [Gemmatimonadales bacterium]
MAVSAIGIWAAACATDAVQGAQFVIRGRVHAPQGTDPTYLWVTWRAEGETTGDSAQVKSDRTFEIRTTASHVTGELLIEGGSVFHPFLYPFHVDSVGDIDVVMVPRVWTIKNGIYQGQVVATSLDSVMDDDGTRVAPTYYHGNRDYLGDSPRYLVQLRSWPEDRMPAKVAFDHRYGSPDFTAQDSADIWGVFDRMEQVFGLDMFEPAEAEPEWWPDAPSDDPGLVPGVIRVVYDPASWWGGLALGDVEPLEWVQELGVWAGDGRFTAFRMTHQLLSGGVLSVGPLEPVGLSDGEIGWETILTHEMLHVLGVGHTCRIPSPQGPCLRTPEPSLYDVAYIELLREVMVLEWEHNTLFGIMPATIGERRILLGLSALPGMER